MRSIVGAVMHIAAFFSYLYVFGVDLHSVALTLSSTGLGLAVVFGNSMRAVYESMVFLFVVRPFQVGDCILYAGERHWVRNFGLLTTLLSRFDGCQVWVRLPPSPLCRRHLCCGAPRIVRHTFRPRWPSARDQSVMPSWPCRGVELQP